MLKEFFENVRKAKDLFNEFRSELPSMKDLTEFSKESAIAMASDEHKDLVKELLESNDPKDIEFAHMIAENDWANSISSGIDNVYKNSN